VLLHDREGCFHVALTSVGLNQGSKVQIWRRRVDDAKRLLKTSRADDFQKPRWLAVRVPEGVPLAARLEDQITDCRNIFLAGGVKPDPSLSSTLGEATGPS